MQNVPWYMDLVGAGFTNHGSNSGGILIETESGGHVELINADPKSAANSAMPDRFFTVEEVYNTNRNPVALGIVHPLVYENEDSLIGQLGYGTGSLMNTDKHAMSWCRNFDGGRSFTTVLGHSWQFTTQAWWQQHLLAAVQWTAGVGVPQLRDLHGGRRPARGQQPEQRGQGQPRSCCLRPRGLPSTRTTTSGAKKELEKFVEQTKKLHADQLTLKGKELIDWAKSVK